MSPKPKRTRLRVKTEEPICLPDVSDDDMCHRDSGRAESVSAAPEQDSDDEVVLAQKDVKKQLGAKGLRKAGKCGKPPKTCRLCRRSSASMDPVRADAYLHWYRCGAPRIVKDVDAGSLDDKLLGKIDWYCFRVHENVPDYKSMTVTDLERWISASPENRAAFEGWREGVVSMVKDGSERVRGCLWLLVAMFPQVCMFKACSQLQVSSVISCKS